MIAYKAFQKNMSCLGFQYKKQNGIIQKRLPAGKRGFIVQKTRWTV